MQLSIRDAADVFSALSTSAELYDVAVRELRSYESFDSSVVDMDAQVHLHRARTAVTTVGCVVDVACSHLKWLFPVDVCVCVRVRM